MKKAARRLAIGVMALALAAAARAQPVTIGVILSTTGPGASLGILEKNGLAVAAAQAPANFRYVYADDASDPSETVRLARRLMAEDKVDIIIGTTGTPGALALIQVAAENTTPVISMAPVNALVQPVDAQRRWIFKTTTNDDHEARPMFAHMKATGVRTLGVIGFADSYGDQWLRMARSFGGESQVQVIGEERFARTDTSVASQVLKLVGKSPDAILIAGSGGAAATPLLELKKRGYKGKVYVTLGATFGDFLRIAGPDAEGIYAPLAAVMGISQVADTDPAKSGAMVFVRAYESAHGAGTANIFAAGAWDAHRLIERAVPIAAKANTAGSAAFRAALRDAIEATRDYAGARGIYNLSATDHVGLDAKALTLGRYERNRWVLQK